MDEGASPNSPPEPGDPGAKRSGHSPKDDAAQPADDAPLSALPTQRPDPAFGPRPTQRIGPSASTPEGDPGATGPSPFADLLAEARAPGAARPGPRAAPKAKPEPTEEQARLETVQVRARTKSDTDLSVQAPRERRIGPYTVLEEIGAGGMAVVHKAVQPALDRLVAIKELRAEYVNDRQISTRFEREATSLATLQHGNIVHVYDYLRDPESAYIVMEHVDGIDLFDVLADAERLPSEVAAIVGLQVAAGLEYAHYRGIVHRDIKPSNILISRKGEVKIMDFGIARDPGKSELTQVGLAVGTPAYMSPEQIRGDRIDFRTDVFATGIVLYEMLAGQKPWAEEEGRSVTVKVLDEEYPPIAELVPDVPAELERVIDRCLKKDPTLRYQSTYELRRDLEIYVNRAVPIDPRGRIVLYLRNRKLVTDAEASMTLGTDFFDDPGIRRRDEGLALPPARLLLKPVVVANAIALLVVLVAVLVGALGPFGERLAAAPPDMVPRSLLTKAMAERPDDRATAPNKVGDGAPAAVGAPTVGSAPAVGEKAPDALAGDEGFVKVVVSPWARVYVDGQRYDTTPFARPIPLRPGQHRIGLRNPYFRPEDRYVEVQTGETQIMKVTLSPRAEEEEEPDAP